MIDTRLDVRPDVLREAQPDQRRPRLHLHWFRWSAAEWCQTSSRYDCRCGATRPGL